jgi:hypothetical protein
MWLHDLCRRWFGPSRPRKRGPRRRARQRPRMAPCPESLEGRTRPSNPGATGALVTAVPNANTAGGATTVPLAPGATFDVAARRGGLGAYLLAWEAALLFCAGLVALAVLPSSGVTVPRAAILAHGAHCALLALLALLLGGPWQGSPGEVPPAPPQARQGLGPCWAREAGARFRPARERCPGYRPALRPGAATSAGPGWCPREGACAWAAPRTSAKAAGSASKSAGGPDPGRGQEARAATTGNTAPANVAVAGRRGRRRREAPAPGTSPEE